MYHSVWRATGGFWQFCFRPCFRVHAIIIEGQGHAADSEANPMGRVLRCSTAGIDLDFIRRTMELGAPFDVVTIHPYRGRTDDRQFIAELQEAANVSWYDFRNNGTDPFNFEHNMGIVTRDFRPKPAYRAYATVATMLGGLHVDRELRPGENNFTYRFIGDQGESAVLALWSPLGRQTIKLPAKKVVPWPT